VDVVAGQAAQHRGLRPAKAFVLEERVPSGTSVVVHVRVTATSRLGASLAVARFDRTASFALTDVMASAS